MSNCKEQVPPESPRQIVEKIESTISRASWNEEVRARKALFLLKARDRRIAYLEKRVVELEGLAGSLQAVIQQKMPEERITYFGITPSGSSQHHPETCKTNIQRDAFDSKDEPSSRDARNTESNAHFSIPNLILTESSTDSDLLSTRDGQEKSVKSTNQALNGNSGLFDKDSVNIWNCQDEYLSCLSDSLAKETLHSKPKDTSVKNCNAHVRKQVLREVCGRVSENSYPLHYIREIASSLYSNDSSWGRKPYGDGANLFGNILLGASQTQNSGIAPKLSSSVPWIRTKKSLRRKSRTKRINAGVSGILETSPKQIEDGNSTHVLKVESKVVQEDAQEPRVTADTKEVCTQTSSENIQTDAKFIKIVQNDSYQSLQETIMHLCTILLQRIGPNTLRSRNNHRRYDKRVPRYGKISRNWRKKLIRAAWAIEKLKNEIIATKKALKEKTEDLNSTNKCFARLKQELETTDLNLNNLISENQLLRKKIEDTRQWMKIKIEEDQHEKNDAVQVKDIQKSRDLANLKKKVDEDFATIAQLRTKLLRSESTNANKGFLLNSYKSQLTELTKDRDQCLSKIKSLQNEVGSLRNSNSHLKSKISMLNNEKDKLLSESEKSESSLKEQLENEIASKYEKSTVREIDMLKSKFEENLRNMKLKTKATEDDCNEYRCAIKEFLSQVYRYHENGKTGDDTSENAASEREAEETACAILNLTPEQLSGMMKEKSSKKINSWLTDFHKIVLRNNFAIPLAKFLFRKTLGHSDKLLY